MFLRHLLQRTLAVLVPLSIASVVYLYLYPVFHGCAFPLTAATPTESKQAVPHSSDAFVRTLRHHIGFPPDSTQTTSASAPFRLLVLADPQIEGDSSLPGPNDGFFQHIKGHWKSITSARNVEDGIHIIGESLRDIVLSDLPLAFKASRKRLDLIGNDFYLAHIYRTLQWWSKPTHVTVLGDLVGSQWVSNTEFESRAWRYWKRVFRGGVRVEDDITRTGNEAEDRDISEVSLDLDSTTWSNRIISLAGNHDVGYSGDITEARIARFDREFGRANWDVRFQLPIQELKSSNNTTSNVLTENDVEAKNESTTIPSLHLIVLNSLPLDTPALDTNIQAKTYQYINDIISHRSHQVEDRKSFTLLLTHLPLHKEEGVCTDPPYFTFHPEDDQDFDGDEPRFKAGGLREQNHMSDFLSHNGILQGVFGMSGDPDSRARGQGRNGLILTGHDHTGCDVIHYADKKIEDVDDLDNAETSRTSWSWSARKYISDSRDDKPTASDSPDSSSPSPSIREVTLRSMMGEYGGNAGLLSIWFDTDPSVQEWKYEITMCPLGVQHIWWAVHVLAVVTFIVAFVWGFLGVIGRRPAVNPKSKQRTQSTGLRNDSNGKNSIKDSPKVDSPGVKDEGSKFSKHKGKIG